MASKLDELIDLDPDFYKGESSFTFPNGDTYEGQYCAHRTGLVWREGVGTYTTQDGQVYKGVWKDDQLVDSEDVDINFPSGVQYYGKILKNKYNGPAIYILENKMSLLCEFLENKPVGEICLVDINGREWRGPAEETEALLLPEHIYFNDINENRGKGQLRHEPSIKTKTSRAASERSGISELYMLQKSTTGDFPKGLEMRIFGKSMQTTSDLRLEDSDWYKNYVKFKEVYENIMGRLKTEGYNSLTADEQTWYQKYLAFKSRYFEIMEARKQNKSKLSEYKLYELFNSKEFKTSSIPMPVFCPTGKYGTFKELTFKDRY